MATPQSIDVLTQGLESGAAPVMTAIVGAMDAAPAPVEGLLEPAVSALRGAPPEVLPVLWRVIARYDERGLDLLSRQAVDTTLPLEERLACVQAMSVFRNRAAAAILVGLLDPAASEPPEIQEAACLALDRLTGLGYGQNHGRWRQWWETARDLSSEEWLARQVNQLTDHLADLQSQLDRQRRRNERLEQRLHATYRDLFPALGYEDQLISLPALLDDELAVVRAFAVGRIERLLRDTVSIPEPLQELLVERLADEEPALRIQAARLLDELAYAHVTERIADRLATESDPEVVTGFLTILARRPAPAALPAIERWLGDSATAPIAAEALWGLATTVPLPEDRLPEVRETLRTALSRNVGADTRTGEILKALALIGDEDDLLRLTPLLDGEDPVAREAVAEGFARRGARRPLVERAANESIYPYALLAITSGPRNMASLRAAVQLVPPDGHRQLWAETVLGLCETLQPDELLAIDDLLQETKPATAALSPRRADARRQRAAGFRHDSRAEGAAHLRLAVVLLESGDAGRRLGCARAAWRTRGERRAPNAATSGSVQSGEFEAAAALDNALLSWIEVLEVLVDRDAEAAVALRDEIKRRFADQLVGEARNRFDAACAALPAPMRQPAPAPSHSGRRCGRDGAHKGRRPSQVTVAEEIQLARQIVADAGRVVCFSGAGLSAESGVPTFRDAATGGLWSRYDPAELASPEGFAANPQLVLQWYAWRRVSAARAKPNPAHHALAARTDLVNVTQNVDDLLERAGAAEDQVIHLHGTLARDRCHSNCGFEAIVDPFASTELRLPALRRADASRGGLVRRAAAVETLTSAAAACRQADALLVIGTSAVVHPAAGLIDLARDAGARIIVVNTNPSAASRLADVELLGSAGTLVPAILDRG